MSPHMRTKSVFCNFPPSGLAPPSPMAMDWALVAEQFDPGSGPFGRFCAVRFSTVRSSSDLKRTCCCSGERYLLGLEDRFLLRISASEGPRSREEVHSELYSIVFNPFSLKVSAFSVMVGESEFFEFTGFGWSVDLKQFFLSGFHFSGYYFWSQILPIKS
jgi:hypothetical protein